MAKFFEVLKGTPHAYFINLEMIENVNPETNEVFTVTNDCYDLSDEDFALVMKYVNDNRWEGQR